MGLGSIFLTLASASSINILPDLFYFSLASYLPRKGGSVTTSLATVAHRTTVIVLVEVSFSFFVILI